MLKPQQCTMSLPNEPYVWTSSSQRGDLCRLSAFPSQKVCLWQCYQELIHRKMCSLFTMMSFSKIRKCSPKILYVHLPKPYMLGLHFSQGNMFHIVTSSRKKKYFCISNQTLCPRFRSTVHVDVWNWIYPLLLKISFPPDFPDLLKASPIAMYGNLEEAFQPPHLLKLYSSI